VIAARNLFMNTTQAVIFDLDGVIVSTDEFHYQAWKQMADGERIPFDREDNERLRGVSRMESLDILLERATRSYADSEKIKIAEGKNAIYRDLLKNLTPSDILPGVQATLKALRDRGIKLAIGSSSKNARPILAAIGLDGFFDAVVDGTDIQRSKPDPEVFVLAGMQVGVCPEHCLVVEDAHAGVEAGLAAGMFVLAVGSACTHSGAHYRAHDLSKARLEEIL
jgi:beta-phosphoglucomutase